MRRSRQMSESIELGIVLALAGGFMDAYSYMCRDEVFANAQTGNMLLLGINLSERNWGMALRYLFPVLAFAVGIALADVVRVHAKDNNPLHLSLKGFYANEGVTFKMGRNQEPLMNSSIVDKRLRIGAKSGIGFWGDGNVEVNDVPNLGVRADGTVSVSNAITMCIGRNGAPTIQGEVNGKWLRIGGQNGVAFWGNGNMSNEDTPHVLIKENSLTIGQVTNSGYALNVSGSIYTEKNGIKTYFGRDTDNQNAWIGTDSKHGLYLGTNNNSCMYFEVDSRNAYIGLIDTTVAQIRKELKDKYGLFVAKGVAFGRLRHWSAILLV